MHVPPRLMATRSSVNICCGLRRAGRAMVVREGLATSPHASQGRRSGGGTVAPREVVGLVLFSLL